MRIFCCLGFFGASKDHKGEFITQTASLSWKVKKVFIHSHIYSVYIKILLPRYDSPQRATVDSMSEKELVLEKLGLQTSIILAVTVVLSFFLVCPEILLRSLPTSVQSD